MHYDFIEKQPTFDHFTIVDLIITPSLQLEEELAFYVVVSERTDSKLCLGVAKLGRKWTCEDFSKGEQIQLRKDCV
jgi:hypothetical protein